VKGIESFALPFIKKISFLIIFLLKSILKKIISYSWHAINLSKKCSQLQFIQGQGQKSI